MAGQREKDGPLLDLGCLRSLRLRVGVAGRVYK